MPVPDDVVRRAQDYDRRAMEEVLADAYPSVYRMAHALTGRTGAARQVMHGVLRQSLLVLPKWRPGTTPENWFYHHTLLRARELSTRAPEPQQDLLVAAAGESSGDPAYVGFVRALRNLPPQQVESFLLHHGENLNTRLLGVAMDCSAGAAHTHLEAARVALAAVSGAGIDVLTNTLARAYQALTPPPTAVAPITRRYVKRTLRPRRLKRLVRVLFVVGLVFAAYVAWNERKTWLPHAQELKAKWWDNRRGATNPTVE